MTNVTAVDFRLDMYAAWWQALATRTPADLAKAKEYLDNIYYDIMSLPVADRPPLIDRLGEYYDQVK